MSVYLRNTTRSQPLDLPGLERTIETLLAELGERGASVALSLVGDAAIRRLNREHRGVDAATDVLSFPLVAPRARNSAAPARATRRAPGLVPERMLGDVVISVERARRQAKEYDATLDSELRRLLIHGVLHLLGHDHEEPTERTRMEAEERRLAARIGLEWPY